ncbi:hypothetical protein GCM10007386_12520 [Pseudoduganella dura]|nr:hypothetical protein GCM10007386_12520 [Pseudoduganella dura]
MLGYKGLGFPALRIEKADSVLEHRVQVFDGIGGDAVLEKASYGVLLPGL